MSTPPAKPRTPLARRAYATLAAVIPLAAATLGVLFLLVPELKPLPRDKIEASVAVVDIENHVSVGRWAHLQYRGDERHVSRRLAGVLGHAPTARDTRPRGSVVYVRLTTDGFKRRSIKLRATLYNADTRTPSHNTRSTIEFPSAGRLGIDAPSRASIQLLFVTDLTFIDGRFFFRVTAYDGSGVLAYADSRPFVNGRFVDQS